jgi:hypothetical protein
MFREHGKIKLRFCDTWMIEEHVLILEELTENKSVAKPKNGSRTVNL